MSNIGEIVIPRVFKYSGANYAMQNRIRECQVEGLTIEECCLKLNVEPRCVASFYEKFQPTAKDPEPAPKAAPAPRRKAKAAEA